MRRGFWRLAAAGVAALLVVPGATLPAAADVTMTQMPEQLCREYEKTPESSLTNAWQLQRLDMETVWQLSTGEGIKVAVIDTGFSSLGSPYLSDKSRFRSYDLLNGLTETDKDGQIDCDHGTIVASIIGAGRSDAGAPLSMFTDFSGIAPDATIYTYRTLRTSVPDPEVREDLGFTVQAIRQAIADDVDVINLSQVVQNDTKISALTAAVNDALKEGIVVVAAAGNMGQGLTAGAVYPAAIPGVISVGISNQQDAGDPNTFPAQTTDIGAPGLNVMALLPSHARENADTTNQAYRMDATGTSFATPVVSGVVALLLSYEKKVHKRTLTPEEVAARLIETADPPSASVRDPFIGAGIVNPLRALSGPSRGQPNPEAQNFTPAPEIVAVDTEQDGILPMAGLGIAIGAVLLVALGLVAAIAIPAATRKPGTHGAR